MKLLLTQDPAGPPNHIEVPGDVAILGRGPTCDVVIDEDFVSKSHLKILRGIVLIDTSTNGTYVDGRRVEAGGIVLGDKPAQIGQSHITIRVVPEDADSNAAVPPPVAAIPSAEETRLRNEVAQLRQQLAASQTSSVSPTDLTNANAKITGLERENEILKSRVRELQSTPPPAAAPAAAPPEPPPDDAPAASLLIFKLQRENAQLKRELAQRKEAPATPAAPAPAPPPVTAPKVTPPTQPPTSPPPSRTTAAPSGSVIPPAKEAPPPPPPAASAPTPAPGASAFPGLPSQPGQSLARLADLVRQDVENVPTNVGDSLDAFLVVESFRFLRRVERVVTRLAGDLIQLYQLHTMVPGVEGSLRELLAAVLQNPTNSADREALLDYLRELGRWMVVALGSYRKAAERFVGDLRDELSAEKLTADSPIGAMKRMSGKVDAELWRRACEHLRELSPDTVQERLDKLARSIADEMIDTEATQAFS